MEQKEQKRRRTVDGLVGGSVEAQRRKKRRKGKEMKKLFVRLLII